MGEAYIVRRGGTGRDGVGGQSNIFFQTTQPPTTNGGIWVKTNLTRYELTSTIIASGQLTGQSWKFTPPSNSGSFTTFLGAVCVYKNMAYAAYNYAEGQSSGNYIHHLQLQSMNLSNGVCSTISRSIMTAVRTNRNTYFESGSVAGYNNLLLVCNWPDMSVITLSGVVSIIDVPIGYYWNDSTNCYESNIVPCWLRYTDSSMNKEYISVCLVNISTKTYSGSGSKVFPTRCIGTDTASKISYSRQAVLATDETTYRTYALNYATSVTTQKSANTINTRCGQCFLNGICYFFSNNLMAYNPSLDTYTNLGMTINSVSVLTGYSLDSNGICWCGSGGTIQAYTLSGTSGTGQSLRTDTVYIATGGTKNYARIVSGEGGSTDIPISGVYTVVNGNLTVFSEAYVSTGGAWTKVTY